ncbi:MAG: efflux RND transporter permease subunit [Acidobacteria bacterium]|nr:efflux RND transporter permease subunit [Acidobacteriota bacterium]
MNPVRSSLRHPQVTLILTLALFVAGIYALLRMPRREDPKITIHTGIVAAVYPGASAEDVESQVTRKIEERLFRMAGVRKDKTFSTSRPGLAFVNVELEPSVKDTDVFWSKLRLELAQLKATDLPEGVRGPIVDSDFGDTVAALIAVHGGHYGYRELKDYAQRLEGEIRTIRAVSKVRRVGEQKERIEITSSLERLSQYGANPVKVIQALKGRNTVLFAGAAPTASGKTPIDAAGEFEMEDQIRRVMIDVSPRGQPVYIGDLADVRRVYQDPTQFSRVDGEPALLLAVEMQEGNNIVDFGNDLRRTLDRARLLLPPDLKVEMVADQPKVVSERIRDFIREFGIAIGAVILVTMVLLPLRVALVSAVAIPVTVAVTFAMLNAFGIELHQVSISALIVVLGMVVDDAIVIVDNYVELLDRGVALEEAAWRSASELAVPVLTATLTIIGSFLPLLMLSGAVGEFIRALPLAVAFALASSYVVAMLVTPLLGRMFIRKGIRPHGEAAAPRRRSPLDLMQDAYNASIVRAMRWKKTVALAGVVAFGCGVAMIKLVPGQFFPLAERNQFVIDVWLAEGSKVEAADAAVRRIEAVLHGERGVTQWASFLGGSAPRFYYNVNPQLPAANYGQILVNTKDADITPELVERLRERLPGVAPEAKVQVKELQQGQVMEAPVEIRISGDDAATLRTLGAKVEDVFRRMAGATYIHTDWREDSYRMKVNVREEVANRLGLTNANIATQLAGGFEGAPVTTFWEGDRDVDVALRLDPRNRASFDSIGDAYVISQVTGAKVPLRAVADFRPEWEQGRIVRRNGVRTLTVRAFPAHGYYASDLLKAADPAIRAIGLPESYRIAYGGEDQNQKETSGEMTRALAISLAAIYLILLFEFRSAIDPVIIMASIPLALPGAAFGLLVTRNTFGFTAFMGIVSLGGVVVRNAIILVDYIRERAAEGVPLEQAAVEAGERRLRPIFLTTMAAAVGVTPMIVSGSSLWSPLASAIAFGLIGSMFFTLVLIPILYVMAHGGSRPSKPALAAVLALMVAAGTCSAESRKLTLDEAVSLAMKQNITLKLADLKAKEAGYRVKGAKSLYLPSVSNETNVVHLGSLQELVIPMGAMGVYSATGPVPAKDIPIQLGNQNFALSQTTVAQPLTQMFKIRAGVDAARAEAAGALEDAQGARDKVAEKVKELYYGILATERRAQAVRLQIKAGELRLDEARNAVESGAALELKAAEGKARLAQARDGLGQLEDGIADLRIELNDLVGLPLDTVIDLAPPPDAAPLPEGLAERVVKQSPEVRAAELQVERARAGVKAARAEYIPEVGAFVQYVYQNGVPLLAENNAAVGLQMKWTLFEFGKRRAHVQERETQLAEAEQNLDRVKRRVQVDLDKSIRKVRRSESTTAAARDLVAARSEARRVAADEAVAGTTNPSAVAEAEGALASAEADLLQAEYNRGVRTAEALRLAGLR